MKIKDLCSYAPKSRIKAGEAVENAKYLFFTSSADENKRYTDFQFDKEAIIMGTGGNATLHYYNGKFSVSTDCLVLFPNSKIKCKYLYYFFKSHMSVLEAGFKGAGLKHTNKKYIEEINVSKVPDLSTQEKIVSHLDTITENIEKLNRELELFDSLTKARFIEMFGDPIVNEKGWRTKPLLDMGQCKNGMNFHYDDKGIDINCLGVCDFKNFSVINNTKGLPTVSLNEMPSEEYLLKDDDIVFVRSNGNKALVGRSLVVYPGNVPTTFSGFCIRYRNYDNEIIVPYLLRVLKTDSVRMKMAGRGANIQNLNQQILGTLVIPVPPIELQQQFADFVEQVDKSRFDIKKSIIELEREVVYD